MKRYAFKMQLKEGCAAEYRKRHDEIWPEIKELLKSSGICDYSIFLEESSNTLFAVQKQSGELSSQDMGSYYLIEKWWAYMADIMVVNPDNSPVISDLDEVFYLE
jgi:L-rhamnose mutarotase